MKSKRWERLKNCMRHDTCVRTVPYVIIWLTSKEYLFTLHMLHKLVQILTNPWRLYHHWILYSKKNNVIIYYSRLCSGNEMRRWKRKKGRRTIENKSTENGGWWISCERLKQTKVCKNLFLWMKYEWQIKLKNLKRKRDASHVTHRILHMNVKS